MNQRRFFMQLGLLTLLVVIVVSVLHFFSPFSNLWDISVWSIALFILLSILQFYIGKNVALSKNKSLFISVILGFVFAKMMLSLFLLLTYDKIVHPQTSFFLLPFFIIYLCYTIFETYFMIKLGKMKPK